MRMQLDPLSMELGTPLGEAGIAPLNRRSPAYVRWTQKSLNRVSSAGLTVDGRFGPRTQGAVQVFQRSRGLTADGVVGPRTEAALVAAGASRPPVTATNGARTIPAPTGVPRHAAVVVPLLLPVLVTIPTSRPLISSVWRKPFEPCRRSARRGPGLTRQGRGSVLGTSAATAVGR